MIIKKPKGTKDILPDEVYKWKYIEGRFFDVCRRFGYKEIRLPVFEHTELFTRGVGDTTDIVQKEMYTFLDKGNRSLTLRPEGTAGVARSFIENSMGSKVMPVKLCYNITAYRYENVQKGRYREFHQLGVEAFGEESSLIDVEVIALLNLFLKEAGRKNISLNINSIGCPKCRMEYNKKLKEFLLPKLDQMCGLCKDRFSKNPLRILDCKNDKCMELVKGAPFLLDCLCDECNSHFESLKSGLDNLKISYNIDKGIVRGLDYYTKTVFEFISNDIGAKGAVCGGGRYDGLIEQCGGKKTPGVGFAVGVERLLLLLEHQGVDILDEDEIDIYIASVDDKRDVVQRLANELRCNGISSSYDLSNRSLKAQMKYADKIKAKYSTVIGENETTSGICVLKNMENGNKKEVKLENLRDELEEEIKNG